MKSTRQFYFLIILVAIGLGVALSLFLIIGDTAGKPLQAKFAYLTEGKTGLPQVAISFEGGNLPERAATEAAFEINPRLPGDFSWEGSVMYFTPATRPLPDTDYRVNLRGGLRLINGGRLDYGQSSWTFHTRPLRYAYLRQEGQAVNLWLAELDNNGTLNARRLTNETERQVLDFSVSPGGERIVYSLQEANQREAGLWLVKTVRSEPQKLVFEANIRASAPRWSPAGELISYERRLTFEKGGFVPAQLWLLRADGISLPPLYGGADKAGVGLVWGAGGDQAYFWEPKREAVAIFNFAGEPQWKEIPGLKPETLAPSPDGREILISYFDFKSAVERQLITRVSLKAGLESGTPLTTPVGFNDRFPVWSPDGKQVAFLRQGPDRSTRLWLFSPINGKTNPLYPEGSETLSHGLFEWSPDSRQIILERFGVGGRPGQANSEIWTVATSGENPRRIATNGFNPKWLN